MRIPIMLVHGSRDTEVLAEHSEALYNNYGSADRVLLRVDQGHNSLRPPETMAEICRFLAFRLTGNLVDFRNLLVNLAGGGTDEAVVASDALPEGWSTEK